MWMIKDPRREGKLQCVHEIESSLKVSITLQITNFQPLALMNHFNLTSLLLHDSQIK
jgi:hypothetical protein